MKWNINDVIHGFKVKKMEYIHEVVSDAYELEHIQSGAKLLYLDNSDDNKVFYICFRTTPDTQKELHILWSILRYVDPENFLLKNLL